MKLFTEWLSLLVESSTPKAILKRMIPDKKELKRLYENFKNELLNHVFTGINFQNQNKFEEMVWWSVYCHVKFNSFAGGVERKFISCDGIKDYIVTEFNNIDFKNEFLTFERLCRDSDIWHREIANNRSKVGIPGRIGEVVISDGEYSWVRLQDGHCSIEGMSMGHCGNAGASHGDVIYSLRNKNNVPYLTFIVNDGMLGESKGRFNKKPEKKFHPWIVKLLLSDHIKGIHGGGYAPEENFSLSDLDGHYKELLLSRKPELFGGGSTSIDQYNDFEKFMIIFNSFKNSGFNNFDLWRRLALSDGYHDSDFDYDKRFVKPSDLRNFRLNIDVGDKVIDCLVYFSSNDIDISKYVNLLTDLNLQSFKRNYLNVEFYDMFSVQVFAYYYKNLRSDKDRQKSLQLIFEDIYKKNIFHLVVFYLIENNMPVAEEIIALVEEDQLNRFLELGDNEEKFLSVFTKNQQFAYKSRQLEKSGVEEKTSEEKLYRELHDYYLENKLDKLSKKVINWYEEQSRSILSIDKLKKLRKFSNYYLPIHIDNSFILTFKTKKIHNVRDGSTMTQGMMIDLSRLLDAIIKTKLSVSYNFINLIEIHIRKEINGVKKPYILSSRLESIIDKLAIIKRNQMD